MTITPYNMVIVIAAVVLVAIVAMVYVLSAPMNAAAVAAFSTPLLVTLVAFLNSSQNANNHAENQARLTDLETTQRITLEKVQK